MTQSQNGIANGNDSNSNEYVVINGISHQKSSHPIFQTTNYSMFGKLQGNRETKDALVKKIAQSIQENKCSYCCPILVTKNLEIIEGQHRKLASQMLNLPVYYVICEDDVDFAKLTKDLNIYKRGWTNYDYLSHYVELGNKTYLEFSVFQENHNGLSISSAITLFSGEISSKKFKEGDLKKDDRFLKEAEYVFSHMNYDLAKLNKHYIDAVLNILADYAENKDWEWNTARLNRLTNNLNAALEIRCYESTVIKRHLKGTSNLKGVRPIK